MALKVTTVVQLPVGTNWFQVREWIQKNLQNMEYELSFYFDKGPDGELYIHFSYPQDAYTFAEKYDA